MKYLLAAPMALLLGAMHAHAAPPTGDVWVTVDANGYGLLQSIQPRLHLEAVRRSAIRGDVPATADPHTEYVLRVSPRTRDALAQAVHRELHHCGGFIAHDSLLEALASLHPSQRAFTPTRPDYAINRQAVVLPMLADVSDIRIGDDIQGLSAFRNRYYNGNYGAQAADWLVARWQAIAAGRSDIHVERVYRQLDLMPSVVLRIEGTSLPEQVLVIGAHLDSINLRDRGGLSLQSARAPGADDDGSGVASVTELLRTLVAHDFHPRRSIELMAYSGEEVGLYGSGYIASTYASLQVDVVGMLQLDMTDYFGSDADITIIDDDTDAQQNAFLESLAGVYLPELVVAHDICGYACSDHSSWYRHGYVASFPFEASISRGEDDPWIHSSHDTWANLGSQALHARKFTRLAVAWVVELSSDGLHLSAGNGMRIGFRGTWVY